MNYMKMMLGGLMAVAATVNAMPTPAEIKKVEPLVMDLMRDDQAALKSGRKTRTEVAESAMALANQAESEAAKLLLMKGAFNLYVRAGEFDKAVETLQGMQTVIPDIPPAQIANIIESSLRVVSRKNGGQLYRLLDETKTRMRYSNEAVTLEKSVKRKPSDRALRLRLAERYAYLGKWDSALENFAACDGKIGTIAKSERAGESIDDVADFWWNYPAGKSAEFLKCFRLHAVKLYENAIASGSITGLNKVQAERRIEEAKEYGENIFTEVEATPKNGKGLYCVIDLSKGHKAQKFPVSYLDAEPKGGWSDEYKTTKLVLRRIEPGSFKIGSGAHKPQGIAKARISKPYYIGVFELTQKQSELIQGWTPPNFGGNDTYPACGISYLATRGVDAGCEWPKSNAVDADSLLGCLRMKTGLCFDIPTEAQWEYASRAGSDADLPDGKNLQGKDKDPTLDKIANYGNKVGRPENVGKYQSNPWGLYDIFGNVNEWCRDVYGNVEGGTDPQGSQKLTWDRVCKGGTWLDNADLCTSHYRIPREYFVDRSAFGVRLSIDTGVKGEVVSCRGNSLKGDIKDPKKYCVIDISKGSKANRYTVSYLAEAPKQGWSRADKTTKLVLRKVKAGSDPLKRYSISKDYYVAIFETTQRQWELIMGKNPVKDQKEDELPVSMVSYADICGDEGFAKTLSSKANIGSFDLPTVAQWEYASRAGTTCRFATGNTNEDIDNTCWYNKNSGGKLKEVGLKQPNAWGIYDMQGNVWERCKDHRSSMRGSNPIGDISGKSAENCGGQVRDGLGACWHGGRAGTNLTNPCGDRGFRIALNLK